MTIFWRHVVIIGFMCFSQGQGMEAKAQEGDTLIFAVVTQPPTDKTRVDAQVAAGNRVVQSVLLAEEPILSNPAWEDLEVCHALRARAQKTEQGYRIHSFRMLDAGMLPMALQGIAGDCLLKKALEYAPQF